MKRRKCFNTGEFHSGNTICMGCFLYNQCEKVMKKKRKVKDKIKLIDNPIYIIEVNENLRRVKIGEPLTRPLKELNTNCHFKKKYDEICEIWDK